MVNQFGGALGQDGADAAFVIICTFIVFTMQSGFGLLESGMVSRKSEANVMVKNMMDVTIGGIAYWFVGYGLSYGPNDKPSTAMSGEGFFIVDVDQNGPNAYVYISFIFQLSFATAATTIVSGCVAERIKLGPYIIFAILNTGLIYPIPCRWVWVEGGWLYGKVHDFAGSCVVHMAGGASALAGSLLLGPRLGRFTGKGKIPMASPTNLVLGTFFLWWGWIGFNSGAAFAVTGSKWRNIGRVATVTMNGAMGGGASVVLLNVLLSKKRGYFCDIGEFCAGILGGLVSITGGVNVFHPWEGLLIGFIGGLVTIGFERLLDKLKIDDPVGCFAVHWGAGLWAMIATGFFAEMNGKNDRKNGVFRGGNGETLGWNILCCIVISAWHFFLGGMVFGALRLVVGIRLSEEDEIKGSDAVEHGILEYSGTTALGKRVEPVLEFGKMNDASV